jgi:cyclopropane fatty-acyl-phospholipid synthase-like methyltransferase
MISSTGIWSEEENFAHAFSYYTARYISKYFEKEKLVIDLGCGLGTILQYLKDVGFTDLIGIEGSELSNFDFNNIKKLDLTNPLFLDKGNVISIEVFEHIPAQYEKQFVDNILNCCDGKLVISVATVGQPGIGHVNCKNNDYIINIFESNGFKFNSERTKEIRSTVENHVDYLRNTLMIFEKIVKN